MSTSVLLSIIARTHPAVWDIIQQGPRMERWERAALNPQPLPPRDAVAWGAADLAQTLARLAIEEEIRGGSGARLVSELVDDWCGTSWPRKWPWPGPGPYPQGGPHPEPWTIATGRAIGAVVFASYASRMAEGELRDTFAKGADQLAESINDLLR